MGKEGNGTLKLKVSEALGKDAAAETVKLA